MIFMMLTLKEKAISKIIREVSDINLDKFIFLETPLKILMQVK